MKVILQGFLGKTGSVIYELLKEKNVEVIPIDILDNLDDYKDEKNLFAIIDFSSYKGAKKALDFALEKKINAIIGTTSLEDIDFDFYHNEALKTNIAIVVLNNFLPSMPYIASFLSSIDDNFDNIQIEETHHKSKKDAPSGTAKMIRKCFDKQKKIPIFSNRVKIYTYEHIVKLVNDYEEITLVHRCLNKKGYALGVYKVLESISKYKGVIKEITEVK